MENVILVIHLFLALAIIGLVLLQRSEGGGLGIGGSGGGMGKLATAKGAANLLTRATWICAAGFFTTSLILGILAGTNTASKTNILDSLEVPQEEAPVTAPAPEEQQPPADQQPADTPPAVPIAE